MPKFKRNGVELHYELDGSGPPVVYATGIGDHSNSYFSQVFRKKFSEKHTVLVVDNRGSGQTVTSEGATATFEDMADDIVAILDHHGLGSTHLLGISMGGMIALTMALYHPHRVRSQIVAVSAAHQPYPSRSFFFLDTQRMMQDAGVTNELFLRVFLMACWGEEPFRNSDLVNFAINAPPDPLVQTRDGYELQIAAMKNYDVRERLGEISQPTLIIASPEDYLEPPPAQQELLAGMPGAELREYPGGHAFMMLPQNLEPFANEVLAFWEQHS